ncbi:HEAT repeat domain-containing protein [Bacillus sp. S3]|uniref:HEAT repeat domain-containing protein n=1 Tax=Bacillus sp. S3 TaxID=486398 RepID=UPI0011893956|nr:HEAT repeat domain-containing protein [Bacillus sp. S3]QCJ41612.1 HEAT repeat domain-containing protein [Bacillus sp. S3]
MKNELFSLSVLTITILCILVILLKYLIIRKTLDLRNREKIENYKETYNPHIYRMLTEGTYSRKLKPETGLQQKAFEELLSRYIKVIEGVEEKERLSELASMYLSDYYRKRLNSIKWSTRMNTLYHIEDFHMISLLDDVYSLTKKKQLSHEELVHSLRILALFKFESILNLLTTKYRHLTEYDYRHILLRLHEHQFDQLVLYFHKAELSLQKAVLEVISIKRELTYLPFIENIISSYLGEIKLRALKAVAQIGYVKNIDPYLDLLYSTKWEERLVAAKLVGSLKEEKALARLIELLHDQAWWVRSQAGQSISQFANGKDVLRKVLETSKDAFAKDMAWEWLHKGV